MIAVCAFSRLRRGEASALKVSDVDFMRKEIRVQRQVQWTDDGQLEIRGPKYGSERTVYVPEGLVGILAERVRLYRPGDDPERWLFPGARDASQPAHAATVARRGARSATRSASSTGCTTCGTSTPLG